MENLGNKEKHIVQWIRPDIQKEKGEIEAKRITEEYNDELEEKNKRDFENLLNSFTQGNQMECPIILKNQEGRLHLVSGNTRLMIARALQIKPEVIVGENTL